MTDDEKVLIDLLYREYARLQSRSAAADERFYKFLSIGVVPLLAFLGYALATPAYRFLIVALPLMDIIGIIVIVIFYNTYAFGAAYVHYLRDEINRFSGSELLRDSQFGALFYDRWNSPLTLGHGIGFVLLVLVNAMAVPVIDSEIWALCRRYSSTPRVAALEHASYWIAAALLVILSLSGMVASLIAAQRRAHAYSRTILAEHHAPPRLGG